MAAKPTDPLGSLTRRLGSSGVGGGQVSSGRGGVGIKILSGREPLAGGKTKAIKVAFVSRPALTWANKQVVRSVVR